MASPFRAFRKYQKTLLAVAGVILMFVFVLGDPLSQLINGGGGPTNGGNRPDAVAVKWDGGQLTNLELDELVIKRRIVNSFIQTIAQAGYQAAIEAGIEPQPLRVEPILGPETPQTGVERDVVTKRLFADAARARGMAISDEYIVNYLQQLGRGISVDLIRQILGSMQVGNRTSTDFILDALRDEMLARNYMASYTFAYLTDLPEQRYQDWLNVNDRVVVEAAAVPAESLLADVPDPTDKELQEFFDEYKEREPMPQLVAGVELPSPTPGFAVPRKVAVQYLLAEFNSHLAKAEAEVTEEEIARFYEDNKDPYFIKAESVLGDADDALSPATDEEDSAETPATEATEDGTTEGAATESSDSATDAAAAPATDDESAVDRRRPFRLAAFAQDTPAGGEATPAADAAESTAAEPSETPVAETAEATPSTDPAAAADAAAEPEEPTEFQPLEEVRDVIRREIAQIKVSEQLEKLMTDLRGELTESYSDYFGAMLDAEAEGKEIPAPPAKLADLTPIAQANNLEYHKTQAATMVELRDTDIGKSKRPEDNNDPFWYTVFSRDVELYAPLTTVDLEGNRYLAMKIEDVPGKVPTLDEVREKVIRAWKIRKASELALKKAEELAKKAQETGASLTDHFNNDPNIKVVKTDPFSYLTVGTVSGQTQQVESFRLSEPEGIIAAGPEFMEKVFSLDDGEVGAAPNHDHSVVYVLKVAEHQNSPAELQQAFLGEADSWYGAAAMSRGRAQNAVRAMLVEMLDQAGIDWVRDPDRIIQQEEAEAEADAEAEAEAAKS